MMRLKTLVAICVVVLFFGLAVQPAISQPIPKQGADDRNASEREQTAPFKDLKTLVNKLNAVNTNLTDSDNDSLPDSIERVIGTDPENNDTDRDSLNDSAEVGYGLDPLKQDSNNDQYPDYSEVMNIPPDVDSDGTQNGLDCDNDNDGVMDGLDYSPNAKTSVSLTKTLQLITSGKPTYLHFQIRPKDPNHMIQYRKILDWPIDYYGTMMELDQSKDDVKITPLLSLESDYLPNSADVEPAGVIIREKTAYVPLVPVLDCGNVVALEGRMYYPQGQPLNISLNLTFSWDVFGMSDQVVWSFKAKNGKYVNINKDGDVKADSLSVPETAKFAEKITGEDDSIRSYKASNGRYLAVGKDGKLSATGTEVNASTQFVYSSKDKVMTLKSKLNNKYVTQQSDGTLAANSDSIKDTSKFPWLEQGCRSERTPMVIYAEEYSITGLSADENYGDDLGLFYGGNISTMVGANILLAYDYLRNATTSVYDMPGLIHSKGMTVTGITKTVATKDELAAQLGGKPIYDIVSTFPPHSNIPIISIFTDRAINFEMGELVKTSYVLGTDLAVNTAQKPVTVTKNLKTNWYNTDNDTQLDPTAIVDAIKQLGLSYDATETLTVMMLGWHGGEVEVVMVGSSIVITRPGEMDATAKWIAAINTGLNVTMFLITLYQLKNTVDAFRWMTKFWHFSGILSKVSLFRSCMGWSTSGTKFLSAVNKVNTILAWVGCALMIVVAGIDAFLMMKAYGYTIYGNWLAWTTFTLTALFWIAITWLSLSPIGPLISLALLIDFLLTYFKVQKESWVSSAVKWLADSIVHRDARTNPDLKVIEQDLDISDKDGDGLDVGDNLTSTMTVNGIITKTSKGSQSDLENSYIKPELYYTHGGKESNGIVNELKPVYSGTKKTTTYYLSAWVEPSAPAINFPFSTLLKYTYKTYYQVTYFWVYTEKYSEKKSDELKPFTTYFDVMPSTFDGLMGWSALTPMDSDADGLNNTDEGARSNALLYDTDADGLNDKHELNIGTDPMKADTDGDGLGDLFEIRNGSDPSWSDSDDDGLSDSIEYAGWVTTFNFSGSNFSLLTRSDPMRADTDSDGVNDPTERSLGFNPCSNDTNGNGIHDKNDNTTHKLSYLYTFNHNHLAPNILETPLDIERGILDWSFILYNCSSPSGRVYDLVCVDPDGYTVTDGELTSSTSGEALDVEFGTEHFYVLGKGLKGFNATKEGIGIYEAHNEPGWGYFGQAVRLLEYNISQWKSFTVDEKNNFFYSANGLNGTVTQYDLTNGKILRTWVPGPNTNRFSGKMTIDGNHHVYCVDQELGCIYEFNTELELIRTINGTSSGDRFVGPVDIDISPYGDLFVLDSLGNRVMKLDRDGYHYTSFGTSGGAGNDNLTFPLAVCYNRGNKVFVVDGTTMPRAQALSHTVKRIPNIIESFNDTDGDGLTDAMEKAGWNITVTIQKNPKTYKVTSNNLLTDTDHDLLPDQEERTFGTDPNKADTDGDGLTDYAEWPYGGRASPVSNATNDDSDGDDLGDGAENAFGSDPNKADSDGDGLTDIDELTEGTDPKSGDTDLDGLNDSDEISFGSSPLWADSDMDLMDDGMEMEVGADPNLADSDNDGLIDGHELIFNTNATSQDSDSDGLSDAFEIESNTDARSADTDGDGIGDLDEILNGMDPTSEDSDSDGILDMDDMSMGAAIEGLVWLVADDDLNTSEFEAEFTKSASIVKITPQELLDHYTTEKKIILAGDPAEGNTSAGALMRDLLANTSDVIDWMTTCAEEIIVRYGVWSPEQTVIFLTNPRPAICHDVVDILRKSRVTTSDGSLGVKYMDPTKSEHLDDLTTVTTTGASLWTNLSEKMLYNVTMTAYSIASTPVELNHGNGLAPGEAPLGNYLNIALSGNVEGPGVHKLEEARVQMFFSAADLDRTGDGDANDTADIDPSTLAMYMFNVSTRNWTRLSLTMDWVKELCINTTAVYLYGKGYAGYIYANVTQLSLFAIAGRPHTLVPAVARAGDDLTVYVENEFVLNGSLSGGDGSVVNYTWVTQYAGTTITRYGPVFSYTMSLPGNYSVVLTVSDSLGQKATDTVVVTVRDRPDGSWNLAVGPVKDSSGVAVQGVSVRIRVGNENLTNSTDALGMTKIGAKLAHIGQNVIVYLTKAGYVPLEYATRINADRKLETAPSAMVPISPGQTGNLDIGPVKNTNGKILAGAEVLVKVDNTFYFAVTDTNGMARIAVPLTGIGKLATVTIQKAGYKDVSYITGLSAGLVPDMAPPSLKATQPSTASGQGGSPEGQMMMSVLLLVLFIAAVGLMVRRPPARGKKDERSEE